MPTSLVAVAALTSVAAWGQSFSVRCRSPSSRWLVLAPT